MKKTGKYTLLLQASSPSLSLRVEDLLCTHKRGGKSREAKGLSGRPADKAEFRPTGTDRPSLPFKEKNPETKFLDKVHLLTYRRRLEGEGL